MQEHKKPRFHSTPGRLSRPQSGYPSLKEIKANIKLLVEAGLVVQMPTTDGSLQFYLPLAHRAVMEQATKEGHS
jgi:hypothetical protein